MKRGVCRMCGCTWQKTCKDEIHGVCYWMDSYDTLCSHCYWKMSEEELEALGVFD